MLVTGGDGDGYGIGVGRTADAVIEQHHDEDGMVWPVSIAPFEAYVIAVNVNHEGLAAECERIASGLDALGCEVLQLQTFSFVLRHPFAVIVQGPQVELGEGIALIGCEAPPLCSLRASPIITKFA